MMPPPPSMKVPAVRVTESSEEDQSRTEHVEEGPRRDWYQTSTSVTLVVYLRNVVANTVAVSLDRSALALEVAHHTG